MRNFTALGAALVSVVSSAAIALSAAPPSLAANQALMLNGIGLIDGAVLPDFVMSNVLGGKFSNYQRTGVPWPMQARPVTGQDHMTLTESVAIGVDNLDAAIATALTKIGPNEHVTVVGLSAGALVADDVLRRLLEDPLTAPDKSKLNFVVVADSSRATFNANRFDSTLGYQYRLPIETKYDTIVVIAEYDGFADFPDRVWNVVAVVNAFAGEILKHVPSVFTDLTTVPEENVTTTTNSLGGVTTRYFVPAERLPIVELLPFLEPHEDALRQIINSAYKRHDDAGGAAAAAAQPASAAAVAADNTPAATPLVADDTPALNTPVDDVTAEVKPPVETVTAPDPVEDIAPIGEPAVEAPEPAPITISVSESAGSDSSAPAAVSEPSTGTRAGSSANSARSGKSTAGEGRSAARASR